MKKSFRARPGSKRQVAREPVDAHLCDRLLENPVKFFRLAATVSTDEMGDQWCLIGIDGPQFINNG